MGLCAGEPQSSIAIGSKNSPGPGAWGWRAAGRFLEAPVGQP